jgi:hypothetical protein
VPAANEFETIDEEAVEQCKPSYGQSLQRITSAPAATASVARIASHPSKVAVSAVYPHTSGVVRLLIVPAVVGSLRSAI